MVHVHVSRAFSLCLPLASWLACNRAAELCVPLTLSLKSNEVDATEHTRLPMVSFTLLPNLQPLVCCVTLHRSKGCKVIEVYHTTYNHTRWFVPSPCHTRKGFHFCTLHSYTCSCSQMTPIQGWFMFTVFTNNLHLYWAVAIKSSIQMRSSSGSCEPVLSPVFTTYAKCGRSSVCGKICACTLVIRNVMFSSITHTMQFWAQILSTQCCLCKSHAMLFSGFNAIDLTVAFDQNKTKQNKQNHVSPRHR
jgi:hypothetical protein